MQIVETIKTANGTYDICKIESEPENRGYTVQINGNEEYFMFIEDAKMGIDKDVAITLFENAPYPHEKLYNNTQLQAIIDYIGEDFDRISYFSSKLPNNSNKQSVLNILSNGSVEDFDRYDTDVEELFTRTYLKIIDIIESDSHEF